jgi:hypothetical protein
MPLQAQGHAPAGWWPFNEQDDTLRVAAGNAGINDWSPLSRKLLNVEIAMDDIAKILDDQVFSYGGWKLNNQLF